jgi:long-chain acyl-CoA synthetase
MLAVPRIFEKIHTRIQNQIKDGLKIKKEFFDIALNSAKDYYDTIDNDRTPSTRQILQYHLAYKFIFSKIYNTFGGRIRFFISGGAPLSPTIINFLRYCKLTILEGYGLTETVAPCTLNSFTRQKPGTVGIPIGDVKISFGADKEILIKSEALFSGYFKNDEETKKVFTEDGYFMSGDVGEFTSDGYLKITDRKKDLIITSGGKNIAPQKIENLLKLSPHIANCVIIGDRKKFVTALISIETESFKKILATSGLEDDLTMGELVKLQPIIDKIAEEVAAVNLKLAKFETIKKFHLMPIELTTDNYLTPSLKVKKKLIIEDYKKEINTMYN